jgi:hypothetical protein
MGKPLPVSEVIARLRIEMIEAQARAQGEEQPPPGSRWQKGDPGDPACEICEGTGYVRFDLPVGHEFFGRIFLCECVEKRRARP